MSTEQKPLTIAVIGCGTMGVAVLSGILSSLTTLHSSSSPSSSSEDADIPERLPSAFITCANRPVSSDRLHTQLDELIASSKSTLKVLTGDNITGAKEADLVILGCKPYMAEGILKEEGMQEALRGKTVVSMLAGMRIAQLEEMVGEGVRVVRAMPNTASKVCLLESFLLEKLNFDAGRWR
jgi:pyrroline-5-carboxylate reductase